MKLGRLMMWSLALALVVSACNSCTSGHEMQHTNQGQPGSGTSAHGMSGG